MLTMTCNTKVKWCDPRTNRPLLDAPAGSRACIIEPGEAWHAFLSLLVYNEKIIMLADEISGQQRWVRVIHECLTIIDQVTERDLKFQVFPTWRTPEGIEAGLLQMYGDTFGRIITVIHIELL
jgi:hypothetical protein